MTSRPLFNYLELSEVPFKTRIETDFHFSKYITLHTELNHPIVLIVPVDDEARGLKGLNYFSVLISSPLSIPLNNVK